MVTQIDREIDKLIKDFPLDVEIIEEPGTGLPAAQCAYCSHSYLMYDAENDKAIPVTPTCERCKAPMDWDKVHEAGGFADKQADLATKAPPRRRRDKMVRESEVKDEKPPRYVKDKE